MPGQCAKANTLHAVAGTEPARGTALAGAITECCVPRFSAGATPHCQCPATDVHVWPFGRRGAIGSGFVSWRNAGGVCQCAGCQNPHGEDTVAGCFRKNADRSAGHAGGADFRDTAFTVAGACPSLITATRPMRTLAIRATYACNESVTSR